MFWDCIQTFDGINIMGRSFLVEMGCGAQQALTSLLRNFISYWTSNTEPAKFVKGIGLDEDKFLSLKREIMMSKRRRRFNATIAN